MKNFFRFGLLAALLSLSGCGGDDSTVFFSVRSWGTAVFVSGDEYAYGVQSVMDDNGNAMVAWNAADRLYSRRYTASGGWDVVATRFDNAVLRVSAYTLAINPDGAGVAAWRVEETTGDFFYARRFAMASGWDAAFQRLCDNDDDGQVPGAAINAAGNILTVFSKYVASGVYARGYIPGSGWDASPTSIDASIYGSNHPQVALDDSGNGVAVWEQYDGTFTNAYARQYSAGTGWGPTISMLDDPAVNGHVNRVHIALNAWGSGVAFWDQQDGSSYKVYARRFIAGPLPGWDTVIFPIASSVSFISNLNGAVDANGNALITWVVQDGAKRKLFARAYSPANGWDASAAMISDPRLDLDVEAAFFALDGKGNGLAVWSQDSETNPAVYSREYAARTGWSSRIQKVYEYPAGYGGEVSSLYLTPRGKALVVLTSYDLPAYSTSRLLAILSR